MNTAARNINANVRLLIRVPRVNPILNMLINRNWSVSLSYLLLIPAVWNESDRLDIKYAPTLRDTPRLERRSPDYTLVCVLVNGASESGPSLRVRALHSCFFSPPSPLKQLQAVISEQLRRWSDGALNAQLQLTSPLRSPRVRVQTAAEWTHFMTSECLSFMHM